MQRASQDKVLIEFSGKPAIQYSLEAFAHSNSIARIVVVYRDTSQREAIEQSLSPEFPDILTWVEGGNRRQDSVWAGLQALDSNCEVVLIHDGARPLVSSHSIENAARLARSDRAACIARPVTDTLKEAAPREAAHELRTVDRSRLWAMETPQAFQADLIRDAYQRVQDSQSEITDDLSAIEPLGVAVRIIENEGPNPKLTTPKDIDYVDFLIRKSSSEKH
jgi:2-C-methyl-D-erythritol 4-phosphate cytidylyltransferase